MPTRKQLGGIEYFTAYGAAQRRIQFTQPGCLHGPVPGSSVVHTPRHIICFRSS